MLALLPRCGKVKKKKKGERRHSCYWRGVGGEEIEEAKIAWGVKQGDQN